MDHYLAVLDRLACRVEVEHVALDEVQVLVAFEMRKLQRVTVQVVVDHHFVGVNEAGNEVRADKAGTAGHENSLVSQSHESGRLSCACRW